MPRQSAAPIQPTVANIERGLVTLSRIIERHGDKYLPLFIMLEEALAQAQTKEAALDRVRKYAKNVPHNDA